MAISPTDFKTRFPEFASVEDSRIQFWLDDAQLEVGAGAWGTLYEKGVFLLAAHLLQLDLDRQGNEDDSEGADLSRVTSKKVGDVQVSFIRTAADSATEDWYLQTSYGSEYHRLKLRVGMGAIAVGGF